MICYISPTQVLYFVVALCLFGVKSCRPSFISRSTGKVNRDVFGDFWFFDIWDVVEDCYIWLKEFKLVYYAPELIC